MNIADKILNLRKEAGLSQETFAEALGVSRQSVSKWESGASMPDLDKVVAMSELFGVSTDYLIKNEAELEDEYYPEENFDEEYIVPQEIPENNTDKKKKFSAKKIIAAVVAACIVIACIGVPLAFGGIKETWWALNGGKVQYTYVLVHGLGGWGESTGINSVASYWGASTGNLVTYLQDEGYKVVAPSVGPISSTWDRMCELYAQLTGTTVDYGEAHSKEHGHDRYGREYTAPLVENWGEKENGGQRVKINLVGHSFGGATIRMLTSMLAYGSEAETTATGSETSPLFKGGKADWVHSVTTLCSPHNGSSLTCILNDLGGIAGIGDTTDLIVSFAFAAAGLSKPAAGVYDFMLDQFGVGNVTDGEIDSAISAITSHGKDHAGYDLSPDGAAEINEKIKTVDDVYYFSYSFSTTAEGKLTDNQVPQSGTFPVLYLLSRAMGAYTGTSDGGIAIDKSWQANDGLVNVVSAQHPANEEWVDYDKENIEKGIWNVMPLREGHHGTVIGLSAETAPTQSFYTDWFKTVDGLER